MNSERKRRYHQAADAFGALIGVCFDLPPFLLIQDAGYIIFDVGFVDVVFYHISDGCSCLAKEKLLKTQTIHELRSSRG